MTDLVNTRTQALEFLMTDLIDYAGLFPPAQLELAPAVENYAHYIREDDSWMMAHFIIPANRLPELTPELMSLFNAEYPLKISLLSTNLGAVLANIIQLLNNYSGISSINCLETKLESAGEFKEHSAKIAAALTAVDTDMKVFFELPAGEEFSANCTELITQISKCNSHHSRTNGFKLRCGGVEAHNFPSPNEIALAINICRDKNVPIKFTAGLHHPIRHFNESVQTKMYGFFNIIIGGMLSNKFDLSNDFLKEILCDEDADHFSFDEAGLSWCNLDINNEEIKHYRRDSLISYGSCSFDEPREDLKELGLF